MKEENYHKNSENQNLKNVLLFEQQILILLSTNVDFVNTASID